MFMFSQHVLAEWTCNWRHVHDVAAYSIIDIQLGHTVQQGHVAWISIMETWTWSTDVKYLHEALTLTRKINLHDRQAGQAWK
jgi:hypothetical protein